MEGIIKVIKGKKVRLTKNVSCADCALSNRRGCLEAGNSCFYENATLGWVEIEQEKTNFNGKRIKK